MGKGDQKSKRGKIVRGTYGVRRPRKKKKIAFNNEAKKEAPENTGSTEEQNITKE